MRILLLLLIPGVCFAQSKLFRADNIVEYPKTETINVTDGMVYKWTIPDTTTARFFQALDGEYELTLTAKKKNVVAPPISVEAESATSMVNAAKDATTGNTTICCINPNAVIVYTNKDFNKQTKLRVKYARGNSGSGALTFRIGSTSIPVSFPSTGSWSTWQEITVSIEPIFEGSQPVQILSTMQGPCNLDYFVFE